MKYSCLTTDSIRLMAESVGVREPSLKVSAMISEDVTFRIRQIISRANKFMQHSNRTKLTCADINHALKWSNCQPVLGHEPNSEQKLRYSYSAEAQVFRYENDEVDLEARHKNKVRAKDMLTDEMKLEARPQLKVEQL